MALKVMARLISGGVKYTLNHKVSSALILLLAIALIFVSTAKFSEPTGAQASQKASVAPQSTEQYFKGQANFDSRLIWESLSDDLISRAEASGATRNDLQQQLDQAKELGREVARVAYIGGYNTDDGNSMQFYVVSMRSSTSDEALDQIFYVFTLDPNGKILLIE